MIIVDISLAGKEVLLTTAGPSFIIYLKPNLAELAIKDHAQECIMPCKSVAKVDTSTRRGCWRTAFGIPDMGNVCKKDEDDSKGEQEVNEF